MNATRVRIWQLLLCMCLPFVSLPGCSETSAPDSHGEPPAGYIVPGRLAPEAQSALSWGDLYAHTTVGSTRVVGDGSFAAAFDSLGALRPLVIALAGGPPVLMGRVTPSSDTLEIGARETALGLLGVDPLLWGVPPIIGNELLLSLAEQLDSVAAEIGNRLASGDTRYLVDGQDLGVQGALASLLRSAVARSSPWMRTAGSETRLSPLMSAAVAPWPESGAIGEDHPVIVNPFGVSYAVGTADYYSGGLRTTLIADRAALDDALHVTRPSRTPLVEDDGPLRLQVHNGRSGCGASLEAPQDVAWRNNLSLGLALAIRDLFSIDSPVIWFGSGAAFPADSLIGYEEFCTTWQQADSLGLFCETCELMMLNAGRLLPGVNPALLTMLNAIAGTMAAATDGLVQSRFASDLSAGPDSAVYYVQVSGADVALIDPPDVVRAPTDLTAVAEDACVRLDWADQATNEEGYVVQRTRYGGFSDLALLEAGTETYRDCQVEGGNVYTYRVRAYHRLLRSDPSNEVQVTAPFGPDDVPPRSVGDLAGVLVGTTAVRLTWTASGDDWNVGQASHYDVRFATTPITEESWSQAVEATDEPAPQSNGCAESFTIEGLAAATDYRFRLKVADEVFNWSELSNEVALTTAEAALDPVLLYVPAGTFTMGSDPNEGGPDERPEHYPSISAFWIDKYEVTNAMYAAALNWAMEQGLIEVEPGSQPSSVYGSVRKVGGGEFYLDMDEHVGASACRITWIDGRFGTEVSWENHPIVGVTWYGAAAYCNWRSGLEEQPFCYDTSTWSCDPSAGGYRLPSEAEWEKAARGDLDERDYPWNGPINCTRCNRYGCVMNTTTVNDPEYLDGASPYGALHMLGNVWEWCTDWYDDAYYAVSPDEDPRGPATGQYRVIRGGSWLFYLPRCSVRDREPPYYDWASVGLRCVRSE